MKKIFLAVVVAALVTPACGGGGNGGAEQSQPGAAADRTIEVNMIDIAFDPPTVTAKAGERVRFVFLNKGKIAHDAYIGDAAAQADHEKEMRQAENGDHGGGHSDDDADKGALTVDAGKTGELTYTFDRAGTFEIGCHQPGHYTAGMKMTVTVT